MAMAPEQTAMVALVHRDDALMDVAMSSPDPRAVYDPIDGEAPMWFYDAMRKLQEYLSLFEELIGECNKKNLRIENQLPDLVKLYQRLLTDANHFYTEVKQDSTFLRDLQIDQWAHFTHASSQFAAEVGTALAAVHADTKRFKEVAIAVDLQARQTNDIMLYLEQRALANAARAEHHDDQLVDLQSQIDHVKLSEARREKKANRELKKKEDALRKAMGAVVEEALVKIEKAKDSKESLKELKNLAESIKGGKTIEELPLGNAPPGSENGGENPNGDEPGGDAPRDKPDANTGETSGGGGNTGGGKPPGDSDSDSSSSSSDSDSSDDSLLRRRRKTEKKEKKGSARTPRIRMPHKSPPEKFDGSSKNIRFHSWWQSVQQWFVHYNECQFSDHEKIGYVGD
jgi:hypothetical protein